MSVYLLRQVGAILGNSEIRLLSAALVRCLKGGVEEVEHAVDALLSLDMRCCLDDASVAMVLPALTKVIVSHHFSTRLRMHSAAVVGAMATKLSDKSLSKSSHSEMMWLLRRALLDVDPGVREVAAKAMGAAYEAAEGRQAGLDAGGRLDPRVPLLAWLLSVLNSDSASWAEKSGAAKALGGICSRLPVQQVETVFEMAQVSISQKTGEKRFSDHDEIYESLNSIASPMLEIGLMHRPKEAEHAGGTPALQNTHTTLSRHAGATYSLHGRDGCRDGSREESDRREGLFPSLNYNKDAVVGDSCGGLQLIAALALVGGHQRLLHRLIPFIIRHFGARSGPVREAALEAGLAVMRDAGLDSDTSSPVHSLGRELLNSDWRSRLGAVRLFGSVIQTGLVNTSNRVRPLEAELELRIGAETAQEYLARLYFLRSDPIEELAEAASVVWKGLVTNTPRLLRRILPHLMHLILSDLTSFDASDTRSIQAGQQERSLRCIQQLTLKLSDHDGHGVVEHVLLPLLRGIEVAAGEDKLLRGIRGDEIPTICGCLQGIACIFKCASKQHLSTYSQYLNPALAQLFGTAQFTNSSVQQCAHDLVRSLRRLDGCLENLTSNLLLLSDKSVPLPVGVDFLLGREEFSIFPVILNFARSFPCVQSASLILESSSRLTPRAWKAFKDVSTDSAIQCLLSDPCSSAMSVDEFDALNASAFSFANALYHASDYSDNLVFFDGLISKISCMDVSQNYVKNESASRTSGVETVLAVVSRCFVLQLKQENISVRRSQVVQALSSFVWRREKWLRRISVEILLRVTRAARREEELVAYKELVEQLEHSGRKTAACASALIPHPAQLLEEQVERSLKECGKKAPCRRVTLASPIDRPCHAAWPATGEAAFATLTTSPLATRTGDVHGLAAGESSPLPMGSGCYPGLKFRDSYGEDPVEDWAASSEAGRRRARKQMAALRAASNEGDKVTDEDNGCSHLVTDCTEVVDLLPLFISALGWKGQDDISTLDERSEAAALINRFLHLVPSAILSSNAALSVAGVLVRYLAEDAQLRARVDSFRIGEKTGNEEERRWIHGRRQAVHCLYWVLGSSLGSSCRVLAPQLFSTLLRIMIDEDSTVRHLCRKTAEKLLNLNWLKSESVVRQILVFLDTKRGSIQSLPLDGVNALVELLQRVVLLDPQKMQLGATVHSGPVGAALPNSITEGLVKVLNVLMASACASNRDLSRRIIASLCLSSAPSAPD